MEAKIILDRVGSQNLRLLTVLFGLNVYSVFKKNQNCTGITCDKTLYEHLPTIIRALGRTKILVSGRRLRKNLLDQLDKQQMNCQI